MKLGLHNCSLGGAVLKPTESELSFDLPYSAALLWYKIILLGQMGFAIAGSWYPMMLSLLSDHTVGAVQSGNQAVSFLVVSCNDDA